jgi:hypothetical protein
MAKEQALPLNPAKISGVCGRLLCCLSYENENYIQAKQLMPQIGTMLNTPGGPGRVVSVNVPQESVEVLLESGVTIQVPVNQQVSDAPRQGGCGSCNIGGGGCSTGNGGKCGSCGTKGGGGCGSCGAKSGGGCGSCKRAK